VEVVSGVVEGVLDTIIMLAIELERVESTAGDESQCDTDDGRTRTYTGC